MFRLILLMFIALLLPQLSFAESAVSDVIKECKGVFTIAKLLEIAEFRSPLLQLSKADREELDGKLIAARSNFFPNVSIDTVLDLGERGEADDVYDIHDAFKEENNWKVEFLIDQKIYTGGRNLSTYKKAKSLKLAEEQRLLVVRNHLFFKIKEMHAKFLLTKRNIENTNNLTLKVNKELKKEKNRHRLGKTPEVYVLRLELVLSRLRAELISQKEERSYLKASILELAGIESSDLESDLSKVDFQGNLENSVPDISEDSLFDIAISKRAESRRFKRLISAAKEEIKTQKSRYLPDVSLFAGYEVNKNLNSNSSYPDDNNWKIGISGNWVIFDSFETKGLVAAAKANESKRRLQEKEFLLSLEKEVRNSINKLRVAKSQFENAKKLSQKAKKALKQIESRYSIGSATQLDLLEAQITLHDSLNLETDSQYKISLAKVYLEKVVGERL